MKNYFNTQRLKLGPLTYRNAAFILELLNTPGWLKFIGDRNVKDLTDARNYIKKIRNLANVKYWVVYAKDKIAPLGVVTFIKRDYLDHHDIGFAFLPGYTKSGYGFEATAAVLNSLRSDPGLNTMLATTVPDNFASIALLGKLGFQFDKQITTDGISLLVYKLQFGSEK
jgi:ribosomal-protein-alanine N-acetyltransferase